MSRHPLTAALDYARRGWHVFPCHTPTTGGCTCRRGDCAAPGKHPRIRGGHTAATRDPEQIRQWWRRWPHANVAIRTGAESGLVVVDIDPRHGGAEELERLACAGNALPSTLTAATGGGGTHHYYAHDGHRFPNQAGCLGAGIDIRGDGGYVLAPPSLHRSGARYEWSAARALAHPPLWLRPAPTPAGPSWRPPENSSARCQAWAAAALRRELTAVANAADGTRNNTLNRAAFRLGQLLASGLLDRAETHRLLLDAAQRCGLGEREATATIMSGVGAGEDRPRVDLPISTVPQQVRERTL